MLLLQMFDLAGVKISSNQKGLKESLRTFWKDFSGEVLAGLNQWLQSGLAATLCRDRLPAEAVSYIRSARMQKGLWWPDHGMTLDTWCLTNSVVTEERLFEEWTASVAHGAEQHEFFEAERAKAPSLAVCARISVNKVLADGHRRELMAGVKAGGYANSRPSASGGESESASEEDNESARDAAQVAAERLDEASLDAGAQVAAAGLGEASLDAEDHPHRGGGGGSGGGGSSSEADAAQTKRPRTGEPAPAGAAAAAVHTSVSGDAAPAAVDPEPAAPAQQPAAGAAAVSRHAAAAVDRGGRRRGGRRGAAAVAAATVDPDVVGTSAALAEDHATRGRGGRYSRGGGIGRCAGAAAAAEAVPRQVARPTLHTSMLAMQGKMSWAEA